MHVQKNVYRKSSWLLEAACAAMLIVLVQALGVPLSEGIADFAIGLAAALMFGVLVTGRRHTAQ